MRSGLFYILILLVLASGCTPVARYRSGVVQTPAEKPAERLKEKPTKPGTPSPGYTSADYRRLGIILRDYLGRPYHGSSRYDPGFDCSRFTREVFDEFGGISLPRTAAGQYESGMPVHREQLFYGDLVFFDTDGGISHVGVYVGHGEFIHSTTSNGVIISRLSEYYWGKRYVGGRRILK